MGAQSPLALAEQVLLQGRVVLGSDGQRTLRCGTLELVPAGGGTAWLLDLRDKRAAVQIGGDSCEIEAQALVEALDLLLQ